MLRKFYEYQTKAEIYHLYHSIQRYTVRLKQIDGDREEGKRRRERGREEERGGEKGEGKRQRGRNRERGRQIERDYSAKTGRLVKCSISRVPSSPSYF